MKKEAIIEEVKIEAEGYFERGEFFCSEAVVQAINNLLGKPYDDSIVRLASGFPIGVGKSGCICGAISGGVMALGMIYGRVHGETMDEKMFPIAKELHDYIKDEYRTTCCRVMTRNFEFNAPERKDHCVEITGKVAEWVTAKLIEDGKVEGV